MVKPSLGFIGAGRVGQALAKRFHQLGYPITGIYSRSPEKAGALGHFLGLPPSPDYPQADILFLTVPDSATGGVVARLAQTPPAGAVVHTSGIHSLEVLAPLPPARCAGFHPLYPFRTGVDLRGDEGMLVAIESPDPALGQQLWALAEALGGQPARLNLGQKAAYHAAAVMASNYTVTLFEAAQQLMAQAGLPAELTGPALANLMAGSLENLRQAPPPQALTGPISRGDVGTVEKHLAALHEPLLRNAYCALGQLTVKLAYQVDAETQAQLRALLQAQDEA
jgi:predicted short-subunit dehydrogenase-like oxidoreductase (DUF2520 family)